MFAKLFAILKAIPVIWQIVERLGSLVQTAINEYKRRKRRKELKDAVEEAKKTKSTEKLENLFRNDD